MVPCMGHAFQWNGAAARAARRALRLRQEDLAEAVGVERKAIVRWEADGVPSVTNAASVAQALGLPLDSLVTPVIEEEARTPATACGSNPDDGAAAGRRSPVVVYSGG